MDKKGGLLIGVVVACVACIALRGFVNGQKSDRSCLDYADVARRASRVQGELLVMRIFATTTIYRERNSPVKASARAGYVHDGSADIIVDLMKADFQYDIVDGVTNLTIAVPDPEVDVSTIGIDPSGLQRVKAIPRSSVRSQKVFTEIEEECKDAIVKRQTEVFSSVDIMKDAKLQAQKILANFYETCVGDGIRVTVVFGSDRNQPLVPNRDVSILTGSK